MRACMVAYTFYDADNRVRRYAELLVSKGWHVDAIAIQQPGAPKYEILNGVHVYRVQKRTLTERKKITYLVKLLLFLFNSMILLCKKSVANKYDVIHIHSVPDFEVFAAIFQKMFGAKIILDIHDLVPEFFTSKFNTGTSNPMFKLLAFVEKVSCSFADHVIIANHLWGARLIERSVPQRKCSVIMNYPDTNIFKINNPEKDKNKFLLVYPGTLVMHQGIETAIRAVALLTEKIPNIYFSIYGGGTDERYFENLVKDLRLEKHVGFHGLIPLQRVPEIMSRADIGIAPTLANGFSDEAFSTKILEFMVLGVPVIVSGTTIHRYYFDDSHVLFHTPGDENELAEKIYQLYENEALRENLILSSNEHVKDYTWDAKQDLYLDLVNNLLK